MPKTNVDIVTLVALQELATATTPTGDDYLYWGRVGELLGRKIAISTVGDIIATQIGTAINRPDRVYQPGVDMPPGSAVVNGVSGLPDTIEDPYLDGLDYSVHRRPIEWLIKGQEWQNDVVGGGFRLTQAGDQFVDGDIITVSFKPEISSVISTPDAVARFVDASGIALVTATSTLTASSQRKLIFIQGATAVVSVTLDATYPEGVLCALLTASGTQRQTTIIAPAGQDIYLNGVQTSFVLGQSEYAYLVRLGTRWYVTSISDGWQKVGQIVFGGVPGPNTISANGQTLQIAEYPRVNSFLDALNAALPGSVISVGAWATDNTKWARDATTIRVPKLGGWFPRFLDLGNNVDPDRTTQEKNTVGSTQAMQIQLHNHDVGDIAPNPNTGGSLFFMRGGTPIGDVITQNTGGNETRPINVGLPALIYI